MDIFSQNSIPPLYATDPYLHRARSVFAKFCLALTFCIVLIACGPANDKVDQDKLTLATQQIAQEYTTTSDLAKAQASLAALGVANPNQWLIFVAETSANDPASSTEVVTALIKLADSSGLHSPILERYALAHGLTETNVTNISASVADQPVAAVPIAIQPENATVNVQAAAVEVIATVSIESPVAEATPTPETEVVIEPTATATPVQSAQVIAETQVNLRAGPGTVYDLAGGLQVGEVAQIIAKNQDASWWKVQLNSGFEGWVFAQLVQASGTIETVALASDIPPPPTAAPVAVAQATTAPVAAAPTAAAPTAAAPIAAAPAATEQQQNRGAPYFKLIESRMWTKDENGGCRGQHLLRINVIDANGARLNGVTLKGIYTGAIIRTGDQGKGDGVMEFDLYSSGEGFIVVNDQDGASVGSDRAEGYTTISPDIPWPILIGAGYCSDDATCQTFVDQWGCKGHHSYEATFQRNY